MNTEASSSMTSSCVVDVCGHVMHGLISGHQGYVLHWVALPLARTPEHPELRIIKLPPTSTVSVMFE